MYHPFNDFNNRFSKQKADTLSINAFKSTLFETVALRASETLLFSTLFCSTENVGTTQNAMKLSMPTNV